MYTRDVFDNVVDQARQNLLQYHLHDALCLIGSLIREVDDDDLARIHESIERDYCAMLDFLANGGQDPSRTEMQGQMVGKAYLLLNKIQILHRSRQTGDYLAQFFGTTAPAVQDAQDLAFGVGMSMNINDKASFEAMRETIEQSRENERKMLLSGMLLYLMGHFDPGKLRMLCIFAPSEPCALLGVVLALVLHEKAIGLFPQAEHDVQELLSNSQLTERLAQINRHLTMASQTEAIEEKIKNELMPVLFKGIQDENLRMGFNTDEDEDDAFEKMLKAQRETDDPALAQKKKEFQSSATELLNLVRDGADTGTEIFNMAMSHAFFHSIAHWFKPFDPEEESVQDILYQDGKPNPLAQVMLHEGNTCDIDRYAFLLLMRQTLMNMKGMFKGMADELLGAEAHNNAFLSKHERNEEEEIAGYVKVVSRLCLKSRWKKQLNSPFTDSFNLLENKHMKDALKASPENLLKMARILNKYGQAGTALSYLTTLSSLTGATSETLQLMAECQQKTGKYRQAISSLIQADVLTPNNTWILTQMINCYVNLGATEEQLECLLRLEALMPESAKITTETGLCLMKAGRYHEAAQRFYKLEIEDKQVIPSMRAIAWCAFKQKKYETAMRYYKKLINRIEPMADSEAYSSIWADYLNAGHTAWIMGDMLSALTFYHKYADIFIKNDPHRTNALAPFDKDKDELMLHGKSEHDIDLMHDIILYRC